MSFGVNTSGEATTDLHACRSKFSSHPVGASFSISRRATTTYQSEISSLHRPDTASYKTYGWCRIYLSQQPWILL